MVETLEKLLRLGAHPAPAGAAVIPGSAHLAIVAKKANAHPGASTANSAGRACR